MPAKNFDKLAAQVRIVTKRTALQQSLSVPWRRLADTASLYIDWRILNLWVRAILELEPAIPDTVTSTLEACCPGFLYHERQQHGKRAQERRLLWQSLIEWIVMTRFAEPQAQGWFDAVRYYAYKDLRSEKAWTLWERTRENWRRRRPANYPTLEEWTASVQAISDLVDGPTEKGRAVEAAARVEAERLLGAVSDVVGSRAFALWLDCVSKQNGLLREPLLSSVHSRCPQFLPPDPHQPDQQVSILFKLIRSGEQDWRRTANTEGWYSALRYHVTYHPRYHRVIQYADQCRREWAKAEPAVYPRFEDWLQTADDYVRPHQL